MEHNVKNHFPYSFRTNDMRIVLFAITVDGEKFAFLTKDGKCEDKIIVLDNTDYVEKIFDMSFSMFFEHYLSGEILQDYCFE